MHQSLRSMSVGSLRVPDNIANSHLVYQTPYHRMENADQKFTTAAGATPQSLPAIYNTGYAIPSPTSLSSSPSTPMLSPVRQSYQQHHQRHFSTSSASYSRNYTSNDLVSMPPHPQQQQHTASQSPQQQDHHQQHIGNPSSLPDIGFFGNNNNSHQHNNNNCDDTSNNTTIKQESQQDRENTRYASNANLGQLLNPVHPLHNVSETTPTQPQQLYNPMTTSDQGYSYDGANTSAGQEEAAPNTSRSSGSMNGSPIDHHHAQPSQQDGSSSGGGSIGMDGYMYYQNRQQPLTNNQHLSDQDASLYPKSLLNPFFAHLSLHDGEATDGSTDLASGSLMLK